MKAKQVNDLYSKPEKVPMDRIIFNIPVVTKAEFETLCINRGIDMSTVLRNFITTQLEQATKQAQERSIK